MELGVITVFIILVGLLIILFAADFLMIYRKNEKNRKSALDEVSSLSEKDFLKFLIETFSNLNYEIMVVDKKTDYGAELIIKKEDSTHVVKVKKSDNPLDIDTVKEAVLSVQAYGAGLGLVVTNSGFTSKAQKFAEENNVLCIDKEKLADMIIDSKNISKNSG